MLTLSSSDMPARTVKYGTTQVILAAPRGLKILQTGAGGDLLFEADVPRGKTWTLNLSLEIVETDAV